MAKRERLLMDFGWRFHLGEVPRDEISWGWTKSGRFDRGGSAAALDDSRWRAIDLPHDFLVEGEFTRSPQQSSAGYSSAAEESLRLLHMTHGSLSGGIAWYRKAFNVPKRDLGRRISLEFDGVFRNCEVYLNEHFVSAHRSGYTSFRFDVTDVINYGARNLLAVRVDATEYEGWFYEGGGIYRHTWLVKTDPLHVAPWGTFVTTEVQGKGRGTAARVTVRTTIANKHLEAVSCRLTSTIFDPSGRKVGETHSAVEIPAGRDMELVQQADIGDARLWSVDKPHLYQVVSTVRRGTRVVDECATTFGIRTIRFDPDRGFFLNGEPLKLKGVCCHQDHAGVGSALPDRLQEFRILRLREMGCNAYRTAHNPPTPELLDACDRLGMLVMNENRLLSSSAECLAELEAFVRRDRNHPSVILWSLGNEEWRIQGTDVAARIATTMKHLVRSLDPTRPVTLAMDGGYDGPVPPVLDVMGFNYHPEVYDEHHRRYAKQPTVVSECAATVSTRGIYEKDEEKGYVSAYDVNYPKWGLTAEEMWKGVVSRPYLSGCFVWTGFDYRGEPLPYSWPCIASHLGIIDLCGFPKDNFYYYQARWSYRVVLHLFPHWNWPGKEGKPIAVWCHTNCDEVELFLNGRSLGRKRMRKNSHLEWRVKYEPGRLEAKGSRYGKAVAVTRVQTTGVPAAIRLTPDRETIHADNEDVSVFTVSVVDARGRPVPTADDEITFAVSGVGRIIGVGNGNPSSHEPDKATHRRAFNGLCQVIVQATREPGRITLSATSPGLRSAAATIRALPSEQRPSVPAAW